MVGMMKSWKLLCLFFILSGALSYAQNAPFASISVNKNEVYVGEPIQIVVTAYTPTYFTAPANFENVKISGAFTVFFKSEPTSNTFNRKRFSGIKRTYNVFPYESKNLTIPPFIIHVTTPGPEGGYKGAEMTLRSRERKIAVKDVPDNFKPNEWLVANNLRMSERWSNNTKDVKVGDVISRTVERTVYGTVAELIHPIDWDSLPNVSQYPARSSIENIKADRTISAKRTEGVRYLFEKEGIYNIPEKEITWWNPVQNRLYKKTLSGITITVKPNPDLGMITSMKDSLENLNQSLLKEQTKVEEEKKELSILGLSLRDFLIALAVALVALSYLIKILKITYQKYKVKRAHFLQSEPYFFMRFLKNISTQKRDHILNSMYQWIDKLELEQPTMHALNKFIKSKNLKIEIKDIEAQLEANKKSLVLNKKTWIKSRKKYLYKKAHSNVKGDWINPQTLAN